MPKKIQEIDSVGGKIVASIFALIFALVFIGLGLFAGVLPITMTIKSWVQARDFVATPAMIDDVFLDAKKRKTTTYRVKVRFAYQFSGREYRGGQIGLTEELGDNIGSYHQDIHAELQAAKYASLPVNLWVDSKHPQIAIYDRSIRWLKLIFLLPFAVLFPGIGLLAGWLLFRLWRPKEKVQTWSLPDALV
ncbi:MAG: DUF3592 domain-containing protein, partial [Gammaproteobacteria bacterium]|nr:DUF3592 domain-containing protein [Gammaproteobacteria bacterium]